MKRKNNSKSQNNNLNKNNSKIKILAVVVQIVIVDLQMIIWIKMNWQRLFLKNLPRKKLEGESAKEERLKFTIKLAVIILKSKHKEY